MAKMTLLEMVQDILADMGGDKVNSIDDTIESEDVAQIIKTSFFEMIATRNWPHLRKLVQFTGLSDSTKPNYLLVPELVKEVVFFRYDKASVANPKTQIEEIRFKEPDEFLRMVSVRDSTASTVQTVTDFSGSSLLIATNSAPTYWTSFDDQHIVTDSYDAGVDTTLQTSKTQAMAYVEPGWSMIDTFIPDLPSEAFPALLAEAKSSAFLSIKQVANQKAEQKAQRNNRWLSRKAWKTNGGIRYEDYGRKSRR